MIHRHPSSSLRGKITPGNKKIESIEVYGHLGLGL